MEKGDDSGRIEKKRLLAGSNSLSNLDVCFFMILFIQSVHLALRNIALWIITLHMSVV